MDHHFRYKAGMENIAEREGIGEKETKDEGGGEEIEKVGRNAETSLNDDSHHQRLPLMETK